MKNNFSLASGHFRYILLCNSKILGQVELRSLKEAARSFRKAPEMGYPVPYCLPLLSPNLRFKT